MLADLGQVGPRTVIWLNEAQHYLGADGGLGERVAAAVRSLLTDASRGPLLVLGTLWPKFANDYTALPTLDDPDRYPQVRELLTGRMVTVPGAFDSAAMAVAEEMAHSGDEQLALALRSANAGLLTQFLAGVPELLRRYHTASPPARALLHAAMDARRLGTGPYLPLAFLERAVEGYLGDEEYDALEEDWLVLALEETGKRVHGGLAPLRRIRHRRAAGTGRRSGDDDDMAPIAYRLADYLEEHGRTERQMLCPPASFWEAAHGQLTEPRDVARLADAADHRQRTRWAVRLRMKAAGMGDGEALMWLASGAGESVNVHALEDAYWLAAEAGSQYAVVRIVKLLEEQGASQEAERLARETAEEGDGSSAAELARLRADAGDRGGAEMWARQAARSGNTSALVYLAELSEKADEHEVAEGLAWEAVRGGDRSAFIGLIMMREQTGRHDLAESLAWDAVDAGDASGMLLIACIRAEAGEHGQARSMYEQALRRAPVGEGDSALLHAQASVLCALRDNAAAAEIYQKLAGLGDISAPYQLLGLQDAYGDGEEAERFALRSAVDGDPEMLVELAEMRGAAGMHEDAERLAYMALDFGTPRALALLAQLREVDGDPCGAEALVLLATNSGDGNAYHRLNKMRTASLSEAGPGQLWPYGLDPDGTPSHFWHPLDDL
ncbi:transcriptional regulator [Streptomyces sp. G1]|uniref:transcriptional regulator n=1 Tax=Streptomyces sp. G1 TaxID=361572 RepID=UPI00202E4819|nr:transcriptional regulator [Streptomyces sp. G1]MCM1967938.1 transcriptional regulator [Streptomyces sp. G1]